MLIHCLTLVGKVLGGKAVGTVGTFSLWGQHTGRVGGARGCLQNRRVPEQERRLPGFSLAGVTYLRAGTALMPGAAR